MPPTWTRHGFQRRAIGWHGYRLDGMSDVLLRCRGASVLDIAASRGMISYELALNGATVLHGVDEYEKGMEVANEVFADIRAVDAKFVKCDLRGGMTAVADALGEDFLRLYDIVIYMAIHHKLKRIMDERSLTDLVDGLAAACNGYFLFRGSDQEQDEVGKRLNIYGLRMIQWSAITEDDAPCSIWQRDNP